MTDTQTKEVPVKEQETKQTKEVPVKEQETKQTKEVKLFGYNGINIVEVKTKKEALDEKTLAKLKAQGITEKE